VVDYDLHQSVDEKTLFMFYKNWHSKDDLDKHFNSPTIGVNST